MPSFHKMELGYSTRRHLLAGVCVSLFCPFLFKTGQAAIRRLTIIISIDQILWEDSVAKVRSGLLFPSEEVVVIWVEDMMVYLSIL